MVVRADEMHRTAERAREGEALAVERVLRAVSQLQGAITKAAERGQHELQEALPELADDIPMQIAVLAHFKSAGYAVHPDCSGGVIRWG